MPEQIWWYLARSSGIVTLIASGAAVIWGLLLSTRVIRRRSLPKWLLDLHRFLGAITIAFLALHLGSLVADNYTHFAIADLAIPWHSAWKPTAVAWGVIAAYCFIVVQATSLVRTHIPKKVWRGTHYASFPAFALALLHAATAGTDTGNRAYVVIAFLLAIVVVFLTLVRVIASRRPKSKMPTDGGAGPSRSAGPKGSAGPSRSARPERQPVG